MEAEGRTAPLVAAFVKAFTAAKQAASNDHEGTATSSQQKVGGPSLVDRVLYKVFLRRAKLCDNRGSSTGLPLPLMCHVFQFLLRSLIPNSCKKTNRNIRMYP